MPVNRTVSRPRPTDPLDDLLLPASDFAKKCAHGERATTHGEKLLSAALLVLHAERESYGWLLREREAAAKRNEASQDRYVAALEEELGPAGVDRVRAYLRLLNRTGVVA